jgi:hypothetical protein
MNPSEVNIYNWVQAHVRQVVTPFFLPSFVVLRDSTRHPPLTDCPVQLCLAVQILRGQTHSPALLEMIPVWEMTNRKHVDRMTSGFVHSRQSLSTIFTFPPNLRSAECEKGKNEASC